MEIKSCKKCGNQPVIISRSNIIDIIWQDQRPYYIGCKTCRYCIYGKTVRNAIIEWNEKQNESEQ